MGATSSQTKKDQITVSYKFQLRKDAITFKIYDDFPYPRKPRNIEIEDQLQKILQCCILSKEQAEQLRSQSFDVKWRLICKHRFMILTGLCDYRQARKSISQLYIESIKHSNSILDLDRFFTWLSREAKEDDIASFMGYGGLNILLGILQSAEVCSRSTKNHTKQILVLKILNFLRNFPDVVGRMIEVPGSASQIFLNFSMNNCEISKLVLQLLNDFVWNSKDGQTDVLNSFNEYKREFNLRYRLEPFISVLSGTKNVIMLESVLGFINGLIEAPEEEERRALIRAEFAACGIKPIIAGIKERIQRQEYRLEDCTYKAYIECQDQGSVMDSTETSNPGNDTTFFFAENEEELFKKKQSSVLKQIEILQNGFLEGLEDMEEDSGDSDSFSSFIREDERNGRGKPSKSVNSLCNVKIREIDFSDVNELFNRTRTKSLENETYEEFLWVMQHFCLIPGNEAGRRIWKRLKEVLQEIVGLGKEENLANLGKLKKMAEEQETLFELQNKITFLTTQLTIRDDEIKQLHFKIKEAEFAKQTYKSSNEQVIKTLLQEKEGNKTLSQRLLETEVRNARLLKDRDEKIKRLDLKIKDLARNLSYTPKTPVLPLPQSQSVTPKPQAFINKSLSLEVENQNLRQELAALKKSSTERMNSPTKGPKPKLSTIPEREEKGSFMLISESDVHSRSQSVSSTVCEVGTQTSEFDPLPSLDLQPHPNMRISQEIMPAFGNNLANIHEIIANKTEDPVGKALMKSKENLESEMMQSVKGTELEELFLRRQNSQNHKLAGRDLLIESLNKRIRELETLINNVGLPPRMPTMNEGKTPHGILRNQDGGETGRVRDTSAGQRNLFQIRIEESPEVSPSKRNHLLLEPFKEELRRPSCVFGGSAQRKKSMLCPEGQSPDQRKRSMLSPEDRSPDQRKRSMLSPEDKSRKRSMLSPEDRSPVPEKREEGLVLAPPPIINLLSPMNMPSLASLFNKPVEGPVKEKMAPKVPMKQVCWTCVSAAKIENTVWERINEGEVEYDLEDLERQFTSKRPEKKLESPLKPALMTQKITLLSLTRSKNISIALSKLKLSLSAISEAAIKMDQAVLKLNVVGSLLEACPKEDEISLVSSFEGDRAQLDLPEQFVLEIRTVPGFRTRLEALQFFLTYKELVEDFSLKSDKLTDLFENVLDNEKFQLLLKYVLAIGNYLNGKGQRGGAYGFKLEAFDKLVDMKTADGKRTFLAYLIELIEKNTNEPFIDANEDLKIYDIGRKLPISQLVLDLGDIKKGLGLVNAAMRAKSENPFDNVEFFFVDFVKVLNTNIREFEGVIEDLESLYQQICDFYCEDVKETPSDAFIEKVFKIWTACKKAKAGIVKEKEMARKEQVKQRKIEEKAAKAQNNTYKLDCPEELANYIKTRRMFRRKRKKKGMGFGFLRGLIKPKRR